LAKRERATGNGQQGAEGRGSREAGEPAVSPPSARRRQGSGGAEERRSRQNNYQLSIIVKNQGHKTKVSNHQNYEQPQITPKIIIEWFQQKYP